MKINTVIVTSKNSNLRIFLAIANTISIKAIRFTHVLYDFETRRSKGKRMKEIQHLQESRLLPGKEVLQKLEIIEVRTLAKKISIKEGSSNS